MAGQLKRSNPMPIYLQALINIAFLFIVLLALLGAVDYIRDSVKIFMNAQRKYLQRNRFKK
jgi:hypothetical protein